MEKRLWVGVSLRRIAVHASAVAHMDRLSRNPRWLHAKTGDRLLRKQSSRDPGTTPIRDRQFPQVQGIRCLLLGDHRQRWSGACLRQSRRYREANFLTTSRAEYRSDRMMAPLRLGPSWPRYRLLPTSCCRRSSILFTSCNSRPSIPMDSKRRLTPRSQEHTPMLAGGCPRGTTGSTRDRSC